MAIGKSGRNRQANFLRSFPVSERLAHLGEIYAAPHLPTLHEARGDQGVYLLVLPRCFFTREAEEEWNQARVGNGRKDMSAREWTNGAGQRAIAERAQSIAASGRHERAWRL